MKAESIEVVSEHVKDGALITGVRISASEMAVARLWAKYRSLIRTENTGRLIADLMDDEE